MNLLKIFEKNNLKKIIGIIGGMGPHATLSLFERIVNNTKADIDQDHLHIIIDNNPSIPDRNLAIMGNGESPVKKIVQSGNYLQNGGAEILLIPCNNSHHFFDEIQSQLSAKLLNMLQLTAQYLSTLKDTKKVGLLAAKGTYFSKAYHRELSKYNITIEEPSNEAKQKLFGIISALKSGNHSTKYISEANQIVNENFSSGYIIKGCTEISLLNLIDRDYIFVDPMDILSKEAIKQASSH
jgi:aspartate racemase